MHMKNANVPNVFLTTILKCNSYLISDQLISSVTTFSLR